MTDEEKTYSIKLYCRNCFTNFDKRFPMGFEAEEKFGVGTSTYINEPGDKYEHVRCPNCGCTSINKVRKM